jgi:hypothetical protein
MKLEAHNTTRAFLRYLICALAIAAGALLGCRVDEAAMDLGDAYSEIGTAINFKANECGNMPAYPLIIPPEPPEYGVRLCGLLILGEPCPFNDYPLFCLELYADICEFCDIPGLNP